MQQLLLVSSTFHKHEYSSVLEIAGIYRIAAAVAEKQLQASILEIPEERLPLCGQWNNELTQLQSHSISKLAL